jgi:putative nucleotidyltransferase with HDIG domain
MGERDLRFRAFAWSVPAVAVLVTALTWNTAGYATNWSLLLTLGAAVIVSELLAVELPSGGSFSLTYPLVVCAVALLGPTGAAAVAALSGLPSTIAHRHSAPAKVVFNFGQVVLTALLPALAYLALGGRPLLLAPLVPDDFPRIVLALLVGATLGVVINYALGGLGYAMIHDFTLRRVWREAFSWNIASQVALGLLGIAIAHVMATEGWLGFALFVVPLVVARQTHSRFLSLREAYADTVRSLVAAIEAKDPYTKGHSVRVARFAIAIAEAIPLEESQVQSIEYAALLHDVGKIGISRAVLAKSGALTDDEYDRIKEHPAIGARILESVPFLDSVRPAVQDHHERIDGKGYGRQVNGADISIEARILAIADSYDAMTADRPYRAALSADAAVAELRSNCDTQFDPEIVRVFLAILPGLEHAEASYSKTAQAGDSIAEA